MSAKHRSINQRLGKAGSLELRREILADWIDNLGKDWDRELMRAAAALGCGDDQATLACLKRLEQIRVKHIAGLRSVVQRIESMS